MCRRRYCRRYHWCASSKSSLTILHLPVSRLPVPKIAHLRASQAPFQPSLFTEATALPPQRFTTSLVMPHYPAALLRSKGVLWFGERRAQRFTFHLSGRRRVELSQEGPWEGPPSCSIVFIGTDAAAMAALRQRFEQEVLGADNTMVAEAEAEVETGAEAVVEADPEAQAAVAVLGECIAANDKMELLPAAPAARPTSGAGQSHVSSSGGGGGGRLVGFTLRSSPLHGRLAGWASSGDVSVRHPLTLLVCGHSGPHHHPPVAIASLPPPALSLPD